MRRTAAGPDPLLLLILASAGLVGAEACGGQSVGEADEGAGAAGTGGSVGGAGGTTGGVGGAGSAPPVFEGALGCTNPTFPFGEEAGYVHCEQGFMHRAEAGRCAQTPLRAGEPTASVAPSCGTDADCEHLANGRCYAQGWFGSGFAGCVSSCETDADCAQGSVCLCGTVANLCVPSNCASDADCGGNLLCASYYVAVDACSGATRFACQQPDDECTVACPAGYRCDVDTTADPIARDCVAQAGTGGTCGRPFLVSGTERLARATPRGDWRGAERPLPELGALTATERLALAAHWQAAALMEHASIAAFARFALELLALGAPAELLEQTTRAIQDEQRHATTCFALASAFAGAPTGPGPLPVNGCLSAVDLESVTVTTFLEGCIGETIAAVEARELSLTAVDPVVRETLARIADDELRHALLAWEFLGWALAKGGGNLADRAHAVLRLETERGGAPASGVGLMPERELALGLPSAGFRADVRRHVLEEIVKPGLDALVRTGADRAA
jgi:hypothetical protein